MMEKVAMCVVCRSEFTDEQLVNAKSCPTCGSDSVPADPRKKQSLTLTDHEWRIVFMWADNHAQRSGGSASFDSILRSVKSQFARPIHLTLRDEVQDVANKFGTVNLIENGEQTVIKPETKQ